MKRLVFGLFVCILLSFAIVFAAESYDVDFTQGVTQPVYFYEGDEVRFQLLGGDHVLILNDVGSSSVKIGLVPFGNEPNNTRIYETILGFDYILKLDLDKDGSPDVNVALYSISEDGEVHIVLQDAQAELVSEENSPTGDVGLVDQVPDSGLSTKTISLIVIGVIIVGLGIYLFFRKGKKETPADTNVETKPVDVPKETPAEPTS